MKGTWGRLQSKSRHGITLFELGVVVTIALVLLALAFLSLRTLLVRTKVSRVREDQRVLSRAIENYVMDYSSLPSKEQGLVPLTRPTAYLGALPRDPFQGESGASYVYLSPNSSQIASVLISPGPDGDLDIPAELWPFISVRNIDSRLLPDVPSSFLRAGNASAAGDKPMTDAQLAVLTTYINLAQFSPEKGNDGDIITVVRY
jgi:type II secretory pathway pseudopilin PulG